MPNILRNLTNPDPQVRLLAVEILENLGPDARPQIPPLVGRLADPNLFVRWAASRALGRINGDPLPGEIEALARLVTDCDLSVRLSAASTLESFGPQAGAAVPDLVAAVNSGDAEFRVAVLQALGAIRKDGPRAVPAMARELKNPDRRVRRAAALAIRAYGADAAYAEDALRQALRDVDADVRRFASEALLNIPVR